MVRLLPELRRAALRLTRQHADADDLVQETCRRALAAQDRFRAGSDLRGWLVCIMRNLHRDRWRRAAREMLVGDAIESFSIPERDDKPAAWREVSDEDLSRAVAGLPAVYRQTYLLRVVTGLSYAAIGRRMGVPSNTVGIRLARARLKIRRAIERGDAAGNRVIALRPLAGAGGPDLGSAAAAT
jgi:RNA polymerase sigma-70 factor (ECF subfamily)